MANIIRTGGGGGSGKLNIFAQPTAPPTFEGIWLQTTNKYSKVVLDENVYLGGTWIADTAISLPEARSYLAVGEWDNKLVAIGGYNNSVVGTVNIYNKTTQVWSLGTAYPGGNFRGASFAQKGQYLYIIGGSDSGGTSLKTNYRYDIENGTWQKLADSTSTHAWGAAIIDGDWIYVVGGEGIKVVEKYSITNNTWTFIVNLSLNTACYGVGYYANKLYCLTTKVGGVVNLTRVNLSDNVVTTLIDLPTIRTYAASCQVGTKLYGFGGQNGATYLNGAGYVDMAAETWVDIANLPVQGAMQAALVSGSVIYIIGGNNGSFLSKFQGYNLQSKAYSSGDFVIQIPTLPPTGDYYTQLVSDKKIAGRTLTWFKNAWLYVDGNLQQYPAYYGNGTAWVKFKN